MQPLFKPHSAGQRIKELDGLRGIAVTLVLIEHVVLNYYGYLLGDNKSYLGGVGVTIFFCLSGFLITSNLLRLKENNSPWWVLRNFYIKRFLRIMPTYYFCLLLIWTLNLEDKSEFIWYHIAYATNIIISIKNNWIDVGLSGVFWSLSVEEQFYIVAPFLILFIKSGRLRSVLLLTSILGIISIIPLTYFGLSALQNYVLPFSHAHELLIGGYAAYLAKYDKNRLSRYILPGWLLAAFLCSAIALHIFNTLRDTPSIDIFYVVRIMYVLVEFQIILMCLSAKLPAIFSLILNAAILRGIGVISYSLYLYHNFYPAYLRGTKFDYYGEHTILGGAVTLSVVFLISYFSYILIELPCNRIRGSIQ